jgi:hypothetical protein
MNCEQFLACTNEAEGVTRHAILGWVPSCPRCAAVLGLELQPFPSYA